MPSPRLHRTTTLTRSLPAAAALLLGVLPLAACSSGGTERTRDPETGVETVRMKGNRVDTPGPYVLAFNLALVREGGDRGYAVHLTYHGERPIQIPSASGVEVRVGDEAWTLRGMVQREISGVVGCTMGVPCSYVTHIVAPVDREVVERILDAEGFSVVLKARRGRFRGTGGVEAIRRIREFVRETGGLSAPPSRTGTSRAPGRRAPGPATGSGDPARESARPSGVAPPRRYSGSAAESRPEFALVKNGTKSALNQCGKSRVSGGSSRES